MPLPPWGKAAKTRSGKALLERQIAATDTQIDRLVYDLYGLTGTKSKSWRKRHEAP